MAKPGIPTGAKATYNKSPAKSVTVVWNAVAGATSYQVQRWVSTTQLYTNLATVSTTYHTDSSGLGDGLTYAYRVQAINADGASNFSAPTSKVTVMDPPNPTAAQTAAWAANGSRVLGWTNNPTTLAPYLYHYVRRWDSGSKTWGQIDKIAGSLSSYTDARSIPDRRLQYRVHTANAAGGGYYMGPIATCYSTPAAPTNVRASWSGVDILVQWGAVSTIATTYRVQHLAEGGAWETVAEIGRASSWRHSAPERGVRHMYRVTCLAPQTTTGVRAYSATATSGWLSAQTNPSPPTDLAPAFAAAGESFPVTYRHNPLSPDSPAGGVQIRWRRGAGAWTTVASATVPSQTVGATEVQVATRTSTSGFSDWSASLMVTVRARPAVTITSPAGGSTVTGPLLPLAWTGPASQTLWEASLYDGAQMLAQVSGTTERSTTITVPELTGLDVYVRVHDGYLWSATVDAGFDAVFTAPSVPSIALQVDEETLTVTASAATPAGASRVELWRRRTGDAWTGDPFVLVGVFAGGQCVDLLPPLCDLEYVTIAWSTGGASSSSEPVAASVGVSAFAVNYGPDLGSVAWMSRGLPTLIPRTVERDTALLEFAGRSRPVEILGDMTRVKVSASGVVVDEVGTHADGWAAASAATRRWFRDPTGQSWPCSLSGLQVNVGAGWTAVAFTAEEVAG